ncbi:MAG TPA: hypothetical protein VGY66_37125, partial [Gemmataceae bacterium]|nr:hypothetical protein [Gemmataceae bacterium]
TQDAADRSGFSAFPIKENDRPKPSYPAASNGVAAYPVPPSVRRLGAVRLPALSIRFPIKTKTINRVEKLG